MQSAFGDVVNAVSNKAGVWTAVWLTEGVSCCENHGKEVCTCEQLEQQVRRCIVRLYLGTLKNSTNTPTGTMEKKTKGSLMSRSRNRCLGLKDTHCCFVQYTVAPWSISVISCKSSCRVSFNRPEWRQCMVVATATAGLQTASLHGALQIIAQTFPQASRYAHYMHHKCPV